MSKPLSSFPEKARYAIAQRRVLGQGRGLGYWSAIDYLEKTKQSKTKKSKSEGN